MPGSKAHCRPPSWPRPGHARPSPPPPHAVSRRLASCDRPVTSPRRQWAGLRLRILPEPFKVPIEGPHQIGYPSADALVLVLSGGSLLLLGDVPLAELRLE